MAQGKGKGRVAAANPLTEQLQEAFHQSNSIQMQALSSSSSSLFGFEAVYFPPGTRTSGTAGHLSGLIQLNLSRRTITGNRHRSYSMASAPTTTTTSTGTAGTAPKWAQKTIAIPPQRRGCHLITSKILKEIGQDLSGFKCGLAHLFLQHTSASLTINENYDSDVRDDTETFLNRVVPEGMSAPWKHTLEGPDDMPAHVKSSMFGCTLTIPITNGKLNMGTWQGIWLCEHRDSATARQIVVTLNGI